MDQKLCALKCLQVLFNYQYNIIPVPYYQYCISAYASIINNHNFDSIILTHMAFKKSQKIPLHSTTNNQAPI